MSRSYLMGWGQFNEAMQDPDKKAGQYVRDFAAGAVPLSGMSYAARKGLDDFQRQHYDMISTMENRIPWLSQNLPPARTRWGDPVRVQDAYLPMLGGTDVARAISPFSTGRKEPVEPIDKWIWENRLAFPMGDQNKLGLPTFGGPVQNFFPPGSKGDVFAQAELSYGQLDKLKVLAGNALKDPTTGLGAKDTLNALVEDRYPKPGLQAQWNTYGPEGKALIVAATVQKFRQAAKAELLEEYPGLKEAVMAQWQSAVQKLQKQPQGQQPPPQINQPMQTTQPEGVPQ